MVEAAMWYEQQSAGLGARFPDSVEAVFAALRAAPERFPIIAAPLRRARVPVFRTTFTSISAETDSES